MSAPLFRGGAVCSPHHVASEAGRAMLESGGNALDAAIACNLVLGVVTPYYCGFGGDLFAMVWSDGLHAYNGSGRAPAAATPDAIRRRARSDAMPGSGPLSITVPGAIEAWFALLERFGSRSFEECARAALRFAADGFVLSERGAAGMRAGLNVYDEEHRAVYEPARAGEAFRQPDLARTIETLSFRGPDPYYRGEIADAIDAHVRARGGLLDAHDLSNHRGNWVEPMRARWRGDEVAELPPNTQGIAVLQALALIGDEPADAAARHHLMIEAVKIALSDLADGRASLDREYLYERRRDIDPERAGAPRAGISPEGGTAYMCATDANGMAVSLIQSNWRGFGSGVTVPGWGINLHSRGAFFDLNPASPHVIAPRKRPLHTLIPAMTLREGAPDLVFGSMGGTGQAQTHVQLLARIVADGEDPQDAIDAPRWFCDTNDWRVFVEDGAPGALVEGLRARGHVVAVTQARDSLMGHAHAIRITPDGFLAASDPRAESAALGI